MSAIERMMYMDMSSNILPPIDVKQSNSNFTIREVEFSSRQKSSERFLADKIEIPL
jgi:hypothetical protein